MSEPKSKCCNVEVYDVLMEIEYDHDDMPLHDYQGHCSKCHEPVNEEGYRLFKTAGK